MYHFFLVDFNIFLCIRLKSFMNCFEHAISLGLFCLRSTHLLESVASYGLRSFLPWSPNMCFWHQILLLSFWSSHDKNVTIFLKVFEVLFFFCKYFVFLTSKLKSSHLLSVLLKISYIIPTMLLRSFSDLYISVIVFFGSDIYISFVFVHHGWELLFFLLY
jgi:hypothetical protein